MTTYSEEEIIQYTNILKNINDGLDVYTPVLDNHIPLKIPEKVSCENCGNTHFFKDHGFRYCNKCFYSIGRVFIKDFTSKDRCHFQKKSVYKRSYHYQNKLEEISKKYNLDSSCNNMLSSSKFPYSPTQNPASERSE